MDLGVYCECGRCVSVAEDDTGSSLLCSCGRRVVVPLLEEFRDRPRLLSAATLERRIRRMIAEGELPIGGACLQCGEVKGPEVDVTLECERYTVHAYGGLRFLILPWLLLWWREEEGVEIHGRDTDVLAPICLCAECNRRFRRREGTVYLFLAVLLLLAGGLVTYFHVWAGVGLAAVGLALFVWRKRRIFKQQQRALKAMLRKVPVYRQVLERYPWAVVILPDAVDDSDGP
jgi:hypothetical protein